MVKLSTRGLGMASADADADANHFALNIHNMNQPHTGQAILYGMLREPKPVGANISQATSNVPIGINPPPAFGAPPTIGVQMPYHMLTYNMPPIQVGPVFHMMDPDLPAQSAHVHNVPLMIDPALVGMAGACSLAMPPPFPGNALPTLRHSVTPAPIECGQK